ncbi:ATP-grasp domain-containing protein [Cupriavidus basilensis]
MGRSSSRSRRGRRAHADGCSSYIPAIREGDKRILLDRRFAGAAIRWRACRWPVKSRGNLAAGGTGQARSRCPSVIK